MKIIAPALVALSVLATPVHAGQGKPGVRMPEPSNGIGGCWNSERNLYRKYSLRFCINEQGSGHYFVSGGGLNCNARLDGQPIFFGYKFAMARAHCGHGTDWTADQFTCTLTKGDVRMPVRGDRLSCTYFPAAWGYTPTLFSANRA